MNSIWFRMRAAVRGLGVPRGRAAPVGAERARLDDGHKKSERRDLVRQRFRKAFERELAGAVERSKFGAADAGNGGDVENAPLAGGAHPGQHRARDVECAEQIGVEHLHHFFRSGRLRRTDDKVPRVLHDDVDTALFTNDSRSGGAGRVLRKHV